MPGQHDGRTIEAMERVDPLEIATPQGVEIAVVVAHPALRDLVVTLLERSDATWVVSATADSRSVAARLGTDAPDVVVVDAGDVARCCHATFAAFPPDRLVVIGPQPGQDYERAALRSGVGGWLPRERLADDLAGLVRAASAGRGMTGRGQP